jgi:hypothetical protein
MNLPCKFSKKLVNKNAIKSKIGELPGNLVKIALTPTPRGDFLQTFEHPQDQGQNQSQIWGKMIF